MQIIKQTIPAGKRLLVTNTSDGLDCEFHGPCEVDREIPDAAVAELVDEKPVVESPTAIALHDRELLVQKIDADGVALTDDVSEARVCINTNCHFHDRVASGGEPCCKCRNLTAGDYFVAITEK